MCTNQLEKRGLVNSQDETFLRQAIALATQARQSGERPFGALLVIDNAVVAQALDQCRAEHDPTAHAELLLISAYCRSTRHFDLAGATLSERWSDAHKKVIRESRVSAGKAIVDAVKAAEQ